MDATTEDLSVVVAKQAERIAELEEQIRALRQALEQAWAA